MIEPVMVDADSGAISPVLAREILVRVADFLRDDVSLEWFTSPAQCFAIDNLAYEVRIVISDGKPLPSTLYRPWRTFAGIPLVVDWNAKEDEILLRDTKTGTELGRITHLAIPKI
jgi:hypothetical protein